MVYSIPAGAVEMIPGTLFNQVLLEGELSSLSEMHFPCSATSWDKLSGVGTVKRKPQHTIGNFPSDPLTPSLTAGSQV